MAKCPQCRSLERSANSFWKERRSRVVAGKSAVGLKNADHCLHILLLRRIQLGHHAIHLFLHVLLVDPAVERMTIFLQANLSERLTGMTQGRSLWIHRPNIAT